MGGIMKHCSKCGRFVKVVQTAKMSARDVIFDWTVWLCVPCESVETRMNPWIDIQPTIYTVDTVNLSNLYNSPEHMTGL
jgi:hypothetical protein